MDGKKESEAKRFAAGLCAEAGKTPEEGAAFWKRLKASADIYEEFVYYMEHRDFLCRATVGGRTVVDILVWQMDHFKAYLDRSADGQNRESLLFHAFETMLAMAEDPAPYLRKMETETGTDYPEKY